MKYNTATLPSGIRVILIPSTSDVVYCGYVVSAGSRHERNGEEGLAHFCEHVSFKGTPKRKASNILNELECVGGDLNAFTNKEDTTYYASVRKEHVARAVGLLTDIVFHSTYPQKEINKEVDVICDEIESYNDSPSELIFDEFENILFRDHPLGHNILGSAERVRGYQTADALRFTRGHYLPQRSVFFLHGNMTLQRLLRMLERATADLPTAAPDVEHEEAATLGPQPGAGDDPIIVHRDTHQSHVVIGGRSFAASDPRRLPLYVLNNLLGGPGMNSRLNLSLREKAGLVYSVDSYLNSYPDTGFWNVYFGCDAHDVARCRRLLERELRRFTDNPLSEARLKAAKKQLLGQIGISTDAPENYALAMGKTFAHYNRYRDIDRLCRDINEVTAEEMQAVAAEVYRPERLTTLIYQ